MAPALVVIAVVEALPPAVVVVVPEVPPVVVLVPLGTRVLAPAASCLKDASVLFEEALLFTVSKSLFTRVAVPIFFPFRSVLTPR